MNKENLILSKKKKFYLFFVLLISLFIILFLIINRPDYLSFGTIMFVFGCFFVFISGIFFFYCLKHRKKNTDVFLLDILYGAIVLTAIISFFLFGKASQMAHRVYTIFAIFILYLFIRMSYKQYFSNKRKLLLSFFVVIAGIEAFRGIIQFFSHLQMKGFFYNENYFGMYLALNIPLALGLLWRKEKKLPYQILFSSLLGLMVVSVLLSRCRTAYAGLFVTVLLMFFIRYHRSIKLVYLRSSRFIRFIWGSASVVILSSVAALLIYLKPMSTIGRFLVWKVSWKMFSDSPVLGVGYSNFSSLYNLYQGRFFDQGMGSELERMAASSIPFAFNEYIESLVEFGILGFVVIAVFWFLVIKSVRYALRSNDNLTIGMSGVIFLYLIMSFFYNPSQILPLYLIFSVCLACVVSVQKLKVRLKLSHKYTAAFSLFSLLASVVFLPTFHKQFRAEQTWHRARIAIEDGQIPDALEIFEYVYPNLNWDGNFMHQYGEILLKTGNTERAIQYLEEGKEFWPNPYLFEDLAVAYERNDDLEQINIEILASRSLLQKRRYH
jgi:O-antigen ligase